MSKRTKHPKHPGLQVIVTISGGVGDVLFKPPGVAVALFDYDVEGCGEGDPAISKDPDGQACCVREWGPADLVTANEHWPAIRKALEGSYSRSWKCPGSVGRSTAPTKTWPKPAYPSARTATPRWN